MVEKNDTKLCFKELIDIFEMSSHDIFNSQHGFYEEKSDANIHFKEPFTEIFLTQHSYPVIKLKRLQFTTYTEGVEIPSDFVSSVYKSLHADLCQITDDEAIGHFITCGINEGRPYKVNQLLVFPDYLLGYIEKYNL